MSTKKPPRMQKFLLLIAVTAAQICVLVLQMFLEPSKLIVVLNNPYVRAVVLGLAAWQLIGFCLLLKTTLHSRKGAVLSVLTFAPLTLALVVAPWFANYLLPSCEKCRLLRGF